MGFLLPYFHGARKQPTSALCLIPLPIPQAETSPKRQGASSFPSCGDFGSGAVSPAGIGWIGAGCGCALHLLAAHSLHEILCFRQLQLHLLSKGKGDTQLEVLRGHEGRGALLLLRHCAFPILSRENPSVASAIAGVRGDASLAQTVALLSPEGQSAVLENKQHVHSKLSAAGHSRGLVLKEDSVSLRPTETLLHPGFN